MEYGHTKQMLTLSYLSYFGFGLDLGKKRNEQHIHSSLEEGLATWKPLSNQWELAWGPAVYKYPFAIFDDNMMYLVKHKAKEDTYAIAIRGTNPIGLMDWLIEDLLVQKMVSWPTPDKQSGLKPKISYSTHLGLNALKKLKPAKGLPGAGKNLETFLREAVEKKASKNANISITGHSLGGALAPLLTLWLSDNQSRWDSNNDAQLSTVAFAGPSPGNKDFATYYESQLGENTERVHNSLDVVPHAWSNSTMKGLLSLYEGTAAPDLIMKSAYHFFRLTTNRLKYEQIKPDTPAFDGVLNEDLHSFDLQMIEQHVVGYLKYYDLEKCIEFDFLSEEIDRIKKKWHDKFEKVLLLDSNDALT